MKNKSCENEQLRKSADKNLRMKKGVKLDLEMDKIESKDFALDESDKEILSELKDAYKMVEHSINDASTKKIKLEVEQQILIAKAVREKKSLPKPPNK